MLEARPSLGVLDPGLGTSAAAAVLMLTSSISELMRSRRCFSTVEWLIWPLGSAMDMDMDMAASCGGAKRN